MRVWNWVFSPALSRSVRSASFSVFACALYRSSFSRTEGFSSADLEIPLSDYNDLGELCLDGGFLSVLRPWGFVRCPVLLNAFPMLPPQSFRPLIWSALRLQAPHAGQCSFPHWQRWNPYQHCRVQSGRRYANFRSVLRTGDNIHRGVIVLAVFVPQHTVKHTVLLCLS